MTRTVLLEAEADVEFRQAGLWYEEQRAGLGREFVAAVDTALTHLAQFPAAGRPLTSLAAGFDVRRWAVARFPYHIIYMDVAGIIRVLAVAHDRRRPGYWKDRRP